MQIETERDEVVFGITINVVVIVESHPAALAMCETYTPAVDATLPSGRIVELPLQIETERVEVVFGITIKVVVIVESHPAALAMCETYTPAVDATLPSGRVVELPLQIETVRDEVVFGITISVVVIIESHPAALAMCETYTPAVDATLPSGRVVELQIGRAHV